MITNQLINPRNIVVAGASENTEKPGGNIILNLLKHGFGGDIYALNRKQISIPGVTHVYQVDEIKENVDLAILAIPAAACIEVTKELIAKGARAFIVFSAGFSEAGEAGIQLELELVKLVNDAGATLIGPNCIGVINETYKGVFTTPIPEYDPQGCELISSSGATAVFIMEKAILNGLRFSNIYSIGNAAQTGVEDILEYMDLTFDPDKSPRVKLLYLESIKYPYKFLRHATSLIKKGCKIAAIKSGFSEAGGRAASSHTGALATSDTVIRALFKKAGVVYCSGREELIAVASVFQTSTHVGRNFAIITHAGGSAVMLTDALSSGGLNVPELTTEETEDLLKKLNPGSSVANPIDFLATGNAKQLGEIIDFCDKNPKIDGMIVVFGSSGLFNVRDVYAMLEKKMNECDLPIYPVLPSPVNAKEEIKTFLESGRVIFPDEVTLGKALVQVHNTMEFTGGNPEMPAMDLIKIREIINAAKDGFLNSTETEKLMEAAGIPVANQLVCKNLEDIKVSQKRLQFPVVMKVIGPVHKTEVNGVRLSISSLEEMEKTFQELMQIPAATGVLVQEMLEGEELYAGTVRQGDFGHLIFCGFGGIFLEILNDTSYALAPLGEAEVNQMIESLKGYPLFEGFRGRPKLAKEKFVDIVIRLAALVHLAPEISEADLNPLIANEKDVKAVDVRVFIDRSLYKMELFLK